CENCNASYTSDPVAASGHTWDEGAVTTPATCEGEGVRTFTCECGETKTESIPANGHSFVSTVISPTCTEDGYTLWECENCNASYTTDPVAASGHAWDDGEETTPATCEGEGVKTFNCANCDETMTEPIPAKGHSYVSTVIPPTCTEDGYTLWKCDNCDASYTSDEVTATGHKWDEGTITTPPTVGCEGVRTFRCTACGEEMTEPVPPLRTKSRRRKRSRRERIKIPRTTHPARASARSAERSTTEAFRGVSSLSSTRYSPSSKDFSGHELWCLTTL
ncbi:MAG: hypothetical protein IJM45_00135, partial [Clostridia bacterium]|nr:hypothetical protein [Clostridia bacterium]